MGIIASYLNLQITQIHPIVFFSRGIQTMNMETTLEIDILICWKKMWSSMRENVKGMVSTIVPSSFFCTVNIFPYWVPKFSVLELQWGTIYDNFYCDCLIKDGENQPQMCWVHGYCEYLIFKYSSLRKLDFYF